MKKNKKGFTLIELLAVIIILGILMLIAIPSVTQYISNSRKNTWLASGSSFINAVSVKANDQGGIDALVLTNPDEIYFIPVSNEEANSCVKLEKGGKTPFGTWWGNNGYAYVIVQLNSEGTSYTYAFTAKDSAGYGLEPAKENDEEWSRDSLKPGSGVLKADLPTHGQAMPNDYDLPDGFNVTSETKAIFYTATATTCTRQTP